MQERLSRRRAACLVVLATMAVLFSASGCESDNPLLLEGISVIGDTVSVTVEAFFDLVKTLWTNT